MSPLDLTIVIPTLNEQRNLGACLEAIGRGFAARVVVVDSGSTDDTITIATHHGVEILFFDWDGHFPKKRNWFLHKHPPKTAWVMFLDADELLTPSVKSEISSIIPNSVHSGYWLSFTNYFLGKPLRGGYPLRKLALFRVGCGEYQFLNEDHWSSCDMEVHEHVLLAGSAGLIRSRIDHRDDRGVDHYMRKHLEYAAWESSNLYAFCVSGKSSNALPVQQRLKLRLLRSPWGGAIYFLVSYIWYGGWRDGSRGFAFCFLKASYFVQVSCRLIERGCPGSLFSGT